MITELFQQALHINSPWLIKSIDFNAEEKRLDIQIDFKRGSTFADPDAGNNEVKNSVLQAAKRKVRGYKMQHFKTIAYLLTGKLDFSKINACAYPLKIQKSQKSDVLISENQHKGSMCEFG